MVIPSGLFAAEMEANSRVMVQVLLLALALQVTLSQHWSYGWLPGGKRSVGELEATIRVGVSVLLWADLSRGVNAAIAGNSSSTLPSVI